MQRRQIFSLTSSTLLQRAAALLCQQYETAVVVLTVRVSLPKLATLAQICLHPVCTLFPQFTEPSAARGDLELDGSHLDLLNGSTLHLTSSGDLEVRSVWCYCLARKGVSQVAPNAPQ
jgi:hypothetical protein